MQDKTSRTRWQIQPAHAYMLHMPMISQTQTLSSFIPTLPISYWALTLVWCRPAYGPAERCCTYGPLRNQPLYSLACSSSSLPGTLQPRFNKALGVAARVVEILRLAGGLMSVSANRPFAIIYWCGDPNGHRHGRPIRQYYSMVGSADNKC